MATNDRILNILIIGNQDWYQNLQPILAELNDRYTTEYINDIVAANKRLWHNSYDILILEEKFSKDNTINLTKMSYAMSRPAIILCNGLIKLLMYRLWKKLSKFTNKFATSKKLIFFLNNKKQVVPFIKRLANHQRFFNIVTAEISKTL